MGKKHIIPITITTTTATIANLFTANRNLYLQSLAISNTRVNRVVCAHVPITASVHTYTYFLSVFFHKDINSVSSNIDITVCSSFAFTGVGIYLI